MHESYYDEQHGDLSSAGTPSSFGALPPNLGTLLQTASVFMSPSSCQESSTEAF